MDQPTTWLMVAMSLGASLIAALSGGWQLYLGYLERRDDKKLKLDVVNERLSDCETDRKELRERIEKLEAK